MLNKGILSHIMYPFKSQNVTPFKSMHTCTCTPVLEPLFYENENQNFSNYSAVFNIHLSKICKKTIFSNNFFLLQMS